MSQQTIPLMALPCQLSPICRFSMKLSQKHTQHAESKYWLGSMHSIRRLCRSFRTLETASKTRPPNPRIHAVGRTLVVRHTCNHCHCRRHHNRHTKEQLKFIQGTFRRGRPICTTWNLVRSSKVLSQSYYTCISLSFSLILPPSASSSPSPS